MQTKKIMEFVEMYADIPFQLPPNAHLVPEKKKRAPGESNSTKKKEKEEASGGSRKTKKVKDGQKK